MICWACQLYFLGSVPLDSPRNFHLKSADLRIGEKPKEDTLPKTNIGPENRQSQKETIVFQSSIFRGYVDISGGCHVFFSNTFYLEDIRFLSILLAVLVTALGISITQFIQTKYMGAVPHQLFLLYENWDVLWIYRVMNKNMCCETSIFFQLPGGEFLHHILKLIPFFRSMLFMPKSCRWSFLCIHSNAKVFFILKIRLYYKEINDKCWLYPIPSMGLVYLPFAYMNDWIFMVN